MNVHTPRSENFSVFFAVLAGAALLIVAVLLLVRYWMYTAKRGIYARDTVVSQLLLAERFHHLKHVCRSVGRVNMA